jgi:hypothetical protein
VEKRRHGAFKIIPRITEGSWVVKQAVGQNTPVLLGRKLTTKYFRSVCMGCPYDHRSDWPHQECRDDVPVATLDHLLL